MEKSIEAIAVEIGVPRGGLNPSFIQMMVNNLGEHRNKQDLDEANLGTIVSQMYGMMVDLLNLEEREPTSEPLLKEKAPIKYLHGNH